MLLRDLGIDPNAEPVRETVALAQANCRWEHAGQPFFAGEVEPCINGRTVAIGAYFGVAVDDIVTRLVSEQLVDGGWICPTPPWPYSPRRLPLPLALVARPLPRRLGLPPTTHRVSRRLASTFTALTALPMPDGRTLLATVDSPSNLQLWDPVTGEQVVGPLAGHTTNVSAMTALTHPDGRVLLATAGGHDRTVRIWDPETGAETLRLELATPVWALDSLPGAQLASALRRESSCSS